jgi:hypothetical protein
MLIWDSITMWSNNIYKAVLLLGSLAGSAGVCAAAPPIGCPPMHDGKRLDDVGLFDGPPSDKAELMPEPGRFVVPQLPKASWATSRDFTLGCFYDRARHDLITVVLPRYIRVCDFADGPQVRCH